MDVGLTIVFREERKTVWLKIGWIHKYLIWDHQVELLKTMWVYHGHKIKFYDCSQYSSSVPEASCVCTWAYHVALDWFEFRWSQCMSEDYHTLYACIPCCWCCGRSRKENSRSCVSKSTNCSITHRGEGRHVPIYLWFAKWIFGLKWQYQWFDYQIWWLQTPGFTTTLLGALWKGIYPVCVD